MENDRNIGERIRQERLRLGLDQGKLAALGGVQGSSQSRYETGRNFPDARYLYAFAAAGADINYVVTGRKCDSGPLNTDLLHVLIEKVHEAREADPSRNIQVAAVVAALYARIEPVLKEEDQIDPIVDREVSILMTYLRKMLPDESEPAPGSQSIDVSGDENRVAGRDFIETKNGSQE